MRVLAAALAVSLCAGLFAAQPASAGYKHYHLCWVPISGITECVRMPRRYRIADVPRPRVPSDGVEFRLTPRAIFQLSRIVNTRGMRPAQIAWIYTPKVGR